MELESLLTEMMHTILEQQVFGKQWVAASGSNSLLPMDLISASPPTTVLVSCGVLSHISVPLKYFTDTK
jgi:hypothetical protein